MITILGHEYDPKKIESNGYGLSITFDFTRELFSELSLLDFIDTVIEERDNDLIIGSFRHQKFISLVKTNNEEIILNTSCNSFDETKVDDVNLNIETLWETIELLTNDIISPLLEEGE